MSRTTPGPVTPSKKHGLYCIVFAPASFLTFGKVNPSPPQIDIFFWTGEVFKTQTKTGTASSLEDEFPVRPIEGRDVIPRTEPRIELGFNRFAAQRLSRLGSFVKGVHCRGSRPTHLRHPFLAQGASPTERPRRTVLLSKPEWHSTCATTQPPWCRLRLGFGESGQKLRGLDAPTTPNFGRQHHQACPTTCSGQLWVRVLLPSSRPLQCSSVVVAGPS